MENKLVLGIALGILAFLTGMATIIWTSQPTPYESYNNAIEMCLQIQDKDKMQNCMVAINSGYTRMVNETRHTNKHN